MSTIPQPNEAPPALGQAFNALAGDLRAHAIALVRDCATNALLQVLALFALARVLGALEAMVRDWKQGRLPPLPAARRIRPRPEPVRRPPLHRIVRCLAPRATARPSQARAPAMRNPAPARARPQFPLARPRHAPAHRAHTTPGPAGFQKPAWPVAPPRALFVTI